MPPATMQDWEKYALIAGPIEGVQVMVRLAEAPMVKGSALLPPIDTLTVLGVVK
jgi:hypothetical protein